MKRARTIKGSIMLNSREYEAEILSERGANCIRLFHVPSGSELLRTPRSTGDFIEQNPFLFGMPLLFPPNRIDSGKFVWQGRTYAFPVNESSTGCHLHGTLHQSRFQTEYLEANRAGFSYEATPQSLYHGFPHAFRLYVEYFLDDSGLKQAVTIKNNSDAAMPFALAFHTTFRMPFLPGSRAENVSLCIPNEGEYERDSRFLPTGIQLTEKEIYGLLNEGQFISCRHPISALLKRKKNEDIRLMDHRAGLQAVYRADEKYRFWMLYNGGASDYVCIEPQTCISNAPYVNLPENIRNIMTVLPGSSLTLRTSLQIEKI